MKTIVVIAPVIESPERGISREHEQANLDALDLGPDFKAVAAFLDTGPSSVENELDGAFAVPGMLIKAVEAQKSGAAGIVVNCMCDPGVKALRVALDIPVLGPAETAFHLAASLGSRFSVIDIGGDTAGMVGVQVAGFALTGKFASARGTDIPVEEIHADADVTASRLREEALKAVRDDGADVLVLGCTGFTGMAGALREQLLANGIDVPVIDPLPLTIRTLAALIAEGHGHSKRGFATPDVKKRLRGYNLPELYEVIG